MKKVLCFMLGVLFLVALHGSAPIYAHEGSDEIAVYSDGERLEFDVPPMIIDGRVMVPMRVIFEAFGAPVTWDEQRQEIHARWRTDDITLRISDPRAELWFSWYRPYDVAGISYGWFIDLDVPPQIVNNRTLVPLRAVSEIFRATVEWDEGTRTVYILTG
ncbi:MAG: copper amine oxidase N-terminal domain-containing protein [Defluviitaleaceae bacterium]|nr:copper amine oxidase N-terminal domain-containing protein [Defluviitaleaceae bacterium]